jgi:hypothetical protein
MSKIKSFPRFFSSELDIDQMHGTHFQPHSAELFGNIDRKNQAEPSLFSIDSKN